MISVSLRKLANTAIGEMLPIKLFSLVRFSLNHNKLGAGRASLEFKLSRSEQVYFFGLDTVLEVRVYFRGRQVWRGRTESVGVSGSTLSLECLGFFRTWGDNLLFVPFTYSLYDRFFPLNSVVSALGGNMPERFNVDTNNRVYASLKKNQAYLAGGNTVLRVAFKPYMRSGLGWIGIQLLLRYTLPTGWELRIDTMNDTFAGVSVLVSEVSTGVLVTKVIAITFTAAPVICFTLFNNSGATYTNTLDDSVWFYEVTNFRLVSLTDRIVVTTLTANATAGTNVLMSVGSTANMYVGQKLYFNSGSTNSEIAVVLSIVSATQFRATITKSYVIGNTVRAWALYGDQIIRHIVGTHGGLNNPLSPSTGEIVNNDIDRTNVVGWGVTRDEPMREVVKLGDTAGSEWALYTDDNLITHYKPVSQVSSKVWLLYLDEIDIRRLLESLYNVVVTFFKTEYGNDNRSFGNTDQDSVDRFGVIKVSKLTYDTSEEVEANMIRNASLADTAVMAAQSAIKLRYILSDTGVPAAFYEPRPYDTCVIANLPPSTSPVINKLRQFRIAEVTIDETGSLEIIPSLPIPGLAFLLTRKSYSY